VGAATRPAGWPLDAAGLLFGEAALITIAPKAAKAQSAPLCVFAPLLFSPTKK